MASPDQPAAVGECIAGRYWVEEVLGRGGMGAVYRVRDAHSGIMLALKRASAVDSRKTQKRGTLLEREYHTLAQLAHPRIIEVHEYGVDEQGPYYTMELLDGTDLDKSGRLPWKQACALLCDVASSLAILHARGLLHRDVSFRNVRCTRDGRAKLIDFGAMTSMGVAKEVVGTPPFLAPEVLQMQELDARADLFSLGALGYYLLTGRNAFPARRFSELRDVWRSRPMPVSRFLPEAPQALSVLIAQLLMLDRNARPQSAAEVMERLCGLAGLPMQERAEVSRAYLTTPVLVGREKALVRARRKILSLVRGDGGTLLIDGVAGSGRSRMLDACVLEGKLLGVTVLRADAGDGARGDWGVARVLCSQLFGLMPKEAVEAARLSRDVLGHVIDEVRRESQVAVAAPERSLLLRDLRDFVLALSKVQRLLLAVDDVDKIDEPSAALLAALAHKTERHSVLLALSLDRERGHQASASLRLLRMAGEAVEIEHLEPEQTQALMGSVFGDVANLQLVAGRIHALSQGSPRATMAMAQHLVDRGLARYLAGSWSLPSQLDEGDLPHTLSDSLASRLSALGPAARELAEALCLADGDRLTLESYAALTTSGDPKSMFAALDELVAARVLIADAERYRFSQRGFLSVLQPGISDDRRRWIHARLADLLTEPGSDVLRRAHHLLLGGREGEAIELLCSINLQAELPSVALLERAIARAEHANLPLRTIHQLRMALLSKASVVLAVDSFRRCLPPVLARLEQDSGLLLYGQLSDLEDGARLEQALARTHERYLATPEHERVYSVFDAIRELARLSGAFCSFAAQLYDLEGLETLPSLAPLVPLFPTLAVVCQVVEASKQWISGRYLVAGKIYEQVLARIAAPDKGGLDEMQHKRTHLGLHYTLGLLAAAFGVSAAEERAEVLEGEREHRVNAWRVRMLLHLNQGNADEARKCQRRAELFQLQESSEQSYLGMGAAFEVMAHADAGDLLGVKSAVDALAALAEAYPGWRPFLAFGQCRYRWLQGDLEGALELLLPAFELAPVGRHSAFGALAGAHVRLLCELGRTEEGLARGREYFAIHQREQLVATNHGIFIGMAQVLARAGEHEQAVRTIEAAIDSAEKLGSSGLSLGLLYETRARIAIWIGDRSAFERFAERCANEYRKARNPALSAKLVHLVEDARQHQIDGDAPIPEIRELLQPAELDNAYETIHSRILECVDESDRARCALTLLLQSTESGMGYLYGVRDARAVLLAALPEPPTDPGLAQWIDQCLHAELNAGMATAVDDDDAGETRSEVAARYTDEEGRSIEPIFLVATQKQSRRIAGVLALHMPAGPRTLPSRPLLAELANALLEHGDVSGLGADDCANLRES